ncbi:heparin lyase I family protein [Caballeronia sp. S22]|uniref:heparin lyase I family protein n=1 Tax=Caballeronia sp. S22 TaxID=3137182 RepID=UPI00353059D9
MKVKYPLLNFVAAFLICGCAASQNDADCRRYALVYRSAWIDGIDSRLKIQAPRRESIRIVPMSIFGGVALKTSMNRGDDFAHVANGAPRAEIAFDDVAHFSNGNEYEIKWSMMVPERYTFDSQQPEIIAQVHQSLAAGSPPFSLLLADNRYRVEVRSGPGRPIKSFAFGSPERDAGKVITWVLRYRPDDSGARAQTDLYADGIRVVHCIDCPNAYPAEKEAYLKLGVYKWWWQTRSSDISERTMYYGDVEIWARPSNL